MQFCFKVARDAGLHPTRCLLTLLHGQGGIRGTHPVLRCDVRVTLLTEGNIAHSFREVSGMSQRCCARIILRNMQLRPVVHNTVSPAKLSHLFTSITQNRHVWCCSISRYAAKLDQIIVLLCTGLKSSCALLTLCRPRLHGN